MEPTIDVAWKYIVFAVSTLVWGEQGGMLTLHQNIINHALRDLGLYEQVRSLIEGGDDD